MKLAAILASALLAVSASAAGTRRKAPSLRADAQKKAVSPSVDVSTPAAAATRDDAALAALGAALSEDEDGLLASAAWPDGAASAMGLRPGDRVWYADRAAVRTRAEAANARRAAAPEERASLVVRRGLETLALTGPETPAPRDFVRGERDLSAREKALSSARAAVGAATARDAVAEAPPLFWNLRADQAFWVRFPDGLPAGLHPGDAVAAESATGLTTDGALDFLAVPPKSRVWARVLAAADDGAVRTLRLEFYKMLPAGGRVYPILGTATALAGVPAPDLARVSPGGTLVVAAPLPSADGKRKRGKDLLLDENARLRVRLLDPVVLSEAPSWWRAGPGLWLKTSTDSGGKRIFQVTHVVPSRSAAAAGLKIGDSIEAVGGRSSEGMDFEEALDALYGPPGTSAKVSLRRPDGLRVLELARGVKFDAKGAASPLPLPFSSR